jgi:hypothetical protein
MLETPDPERRIRDGLRLAADSLEAARLVFSLSRLPSSAEHPHNAGVREKSGLASDAARLLRGVAENGYKEAAAMRDALEPYREALARRRKESGRGDVHAGKFAAPSWHEAACNVVEALSTELRKTQARDGLPVGTVLYFESPAPEPDPLADLEVLRDASSRILDAVGHDTKAAIRAIEAGLDTEARDLRALVEARMAASSPAKSSRKRAIPKVTTALAERIAQAIYAAIHHVPVPSLEDIVRAFGVRPDTLRKRARKPEHTGDRKLHDALTVYDRARGGKPGPARGAFKADGRLEVPDGDPE